jgi:hypothetical protein
LIDEKQVINEKVQTILVLGASSVNGELGSRFTRPEGNHKISVMVNGDISKTDNIQLSKDLYIGVNYDRQTKEISFIYNDQPFGYD